MLSDIYNNCNSVIDEFVDSVWREELVPVGILTDDFVGKFSKLANWKSFSKFYGVTATIDMIQQYHHSFVWIILLAARNYRGN